MFGFGKKNEKKEIAKSDVEKEQSDPSLSWFSRVSKGLGRTRSNLGSGLANLVLGSKTIDEDLFEEIETLLLMADIGIEATQNIMTELTQAAQRKELADSGALYEKLKAMLTAILEPVSQPLVIPKSDSPFVVLVVGVNGAGKTTSIGKLANFYKQQGLKVMLAAGDTFRAAAVEQLQAWGERNDVPVIAQHTGADSASVIFDAVEAAKARGIDVLLADTAGRLQNKDHLMAELEKVVRVMRKLDVEAPHETLLVLDSGTGQNAISQATEFAKTVPLSGLALTKLDGTAKGGVIFALAQQMNLPIRFIGVGESIDDLRPFDAALFTEALFTSE